MPIPDALSALQQQDRPTLETVPCRLDEVTIARLAALQQRIGCKRGQLVREAVKAGLAAIESQLDDRCEVVISG